MLNFSYIKKLRSKLRRYSRLPYDSLCYLVDSEYDIFTESYFHEAIQLERRRAGRSQRPFFIMLLDLGKFPREGGGDIMRKASSVLFSNTRDTDIKGWFKYDAVMGVIFTETDVAQQEAVRRKVENALVALCGQGLAGRIAISIHVFPDAENKSQHSWDNIESHLMEMNEQKKFSRFMKRALDIAGGIMCLILFSPFFFVIPLLIKITSRGPVIFKQERIGLHGRPFTFPKFRSMLVNQSDAIHRAYVKDLIRGKTGDGDKDNCKEKAEEPQNKIFKIKNDPRITPIGGFLRKASLDELPQFLSVIKGDMSLVGPRPPIPYEVEDYDIWHLRRILDLKPGITGLWQVKGRSATSFDDMVRLDLQYAKTWSFWLDIRILLQTPKAVFSGKGAY